MTCRSVVFPFTAIVGQEKMKRALILNAINPNLGGVLIRGKKGTAKSTAVRALANLLPQIEVVKGCPFGCSPKNDHQMCKECLERKNKGERLPVEKRKMRVVDLPLGATEDKVIGTIDLEKAIKSGEKIFEPGILAQAHRGILYVDEVNLLDDHLVDVLLDSAAMGINIVEREGISYSHPAHFILVGTMNPEEGELRPQLLDRFGLCVNVETINDAKLRVEIIQRCIEYEEDPHLFEEVRKKEEKILQDKIVKAKKLLKDVKYSAEILKLIAEICIEMKVDGHRADISMLKVAETIAAYHLGKEVTEDDVKEAAELVLPHRMRKKPFQEPEIEKERLEESIRKIEDRSQKKEVRKQKANHRPRNSPQSTNSQQKTEGRSDFRHEQSEDGSKMSEETKEVTFNIGEEFKVKNIPLKEEHKAKGGSGRRTRIKSDSKSGRYIRSEIAKEKRDDIALDATLRAAAPYQIKRRQSMNSPQSIVHSQQNQNQRPSTVDRGLIIEPQDIRQKVREKKVRNIILLLIDSSGSMGANNKMVETKGAILSLLTDAYQKRDKIGLVAFKGNKAELLLPPTQSVELAKKRLEELPTGGKTPLSLGLLKSYEILEIQKKKAPKSVLSLILITDGRANVSTYNKAPLEEAKEIAQNIRAEGIKSIIIDTEKDFISLGYAKEISEELGGKYYKVEELKSQFLIDIIKGLEF